ncbi:MAG TPA: alpha-amylase family glycosyl hydrolase [Hanamia sp.]
MNIILLIIPLIMGGCSKSKIPSTYTPPVSTPPTTVTTDTLPAQYGTPFSEVPDTKDVVMYEVNIRAFSAQHNLEGVVGRLDSIKNLGVNTIWLMPIYPVGKIKAVAPMGSPYSVQNYTAVNPDFGTLSDLQTLVSNAHKEGMSVILDWVADHTSWDNVWISNKSWYQQDGSGNIISPPGQTWTDVAALNYNNNDMRKAMINAMKYWVLAGNIDGFRCDYADGPPADFWQQAIDSLHAMQPSHKLILLAETETPSIFKAGFQMEYAWNYYTALKNVFGNGQSASTLFSTNSSENSTVPAGSFMLRFTSNHDEDLDDNTPIALFNGNQGSIAAFVLASYMGGEPLI